MAAPLARRYAQAYFDLANQAGKIAEWGKDLERARRTMRDPRLAAAMTNPRVRVPDRIGLAMSVLDGVSAPARNLVRLLLTRGRLRLLDDVAESYATLAEEASGVLRATVASAVELDKTTQQRIAQVLTERLGQPVRIETRPDPALVGGLVIRVGDRVIDDSVLTHLQQLQAVLA